MLWKSQEQTERIMDASTKRILVVDDEEVVRLSYSRVLSGSHCQVMSAWTRSEISRLLQQEPCDVVLLDLRMPEVDGMTVLKMIRDCWPESEVIIVTGYPTIESAKEALTLGACDYLAKPVGPDQIIAAANAAMLHKVWALRCEPNMDETRPDEVPGNIANITCCL
jgi:DNA-binding NtrC family response regulator